MFIKAPPKATSEHDGSFHCDPANPVITILGKYQHLFHNTATFIYFPILQ